MIVHVVLFNPAGDLTDSTRTDILSSVEIIAREIPSISRFRVGRRVRHGLPGYEQMMRDDYQYALLIEFENLDGLKDYLAHPLHTRIGSHFTASASRSLAYDFEMIDAAYLSGVKT